MDPKLASKFWDWSDEELRAADEENTKKRAEKDAKPRAVWRWVLDPLHLFDHHGLIVKWAKTLEKPGDNERRMVQPQTVKISGKAESDAV